VKTLAEKAAPKLSISTTLPLRSALFASYNQWHVNSFDLHHAQKFALFMAGKWLIDKQSAA
jgi:hypothetical protein